MESNEVPPSFPQQPPLNSPPPPPQAPPIIAASVAPRPPRRGEGWMILAFVLLALLILSVLFNFGQFASGFSRAKNVRGRMAGPRLDEVFLQDNGAANKIAVLDLDGIITSRSLDRSGFTMVDLLKAQLDRAEDDSRVKAVILRVDSPGGEVLASDEIYRAITDFQDKSGKPVITSMGNLAASGGYYVSSASRWIVANELTITGSIGVIMHSWNYRGLMDKVGLRPEVYKSGKFKDMLSGSRDPSEIPPEEHAMVQSLIDQTYARFKEVVAAGRKAAHEENKSNGKALADDWTDYADGRVLSGTQAFDLGFVDQLGDFDAAVNEARELGKISGEANLVQYQQHLDLGDFLSIFGKSQTPVIKVDLGMDTPKLEAGQLYFLSPTFLH
jgi:protease-4